MRIFPASDTTSSRQKAKVSTILIAVGLKQLDMDCVPFMVAVTFADILRCQEISFVFSQQLCEGHFYSIKAGKNIGYESSICINKTCLIIKHA